MSLHPRSVPAIPEETTRIAKAAFRKGNPYMKMRDELGTFFSDDQFLDLYPADGQPAFSPWRLALVCVMQFAENLTDRQAADAVRAVSSRRDQAPEQSAARFGNWELPNFRLLPT